MIPYYQRYFRTTLKTITVKFFCRIRYVYTYVYPNYGVVFSEYPQLPSSSNSPRTTIHRATIFLKNNNTVIQYSYIYYHIFVLSYYNTLLGNIISGKMDFTLVLPW